MSASEHADRIREAERLLNSHEERGRVQIDIERYKDLLGAAMAAEQRATEAERNVTSLVEDAEREGGL